MKNCLLFIILITVFFGCNQKSSDTPDTELEPIVLLISFDGFRFDYVEKFNLPTLSDLKESSVVAERMIPVYPSKTFPNHYSIATGMYPLNHGLVDNSFYDPERGERYSINNRNRVEDEYYYSGRPIWNHVQDFGIRSASFFWVGSEAPVNGRYPNKYFRYDGDIPNQVRVDTVVSWLKLSKNERPGFISLYFSMVDSNGHRYGTDSDETREAAMEADALIRNLVKRTRQLDLNLNIIIVSDHGMLSLYNTDSTFIYEEDLFKQDTGIVTLSSGTHAQLYVKDKSRMDSLYQNILSNKDSRFEVYPKDSIPDHLNYGNHQRIGDILLMAKPGYSFRSKNAKPEEREVWGVHGYDPYDCMEMGSFFMAFGPEIKQGVVIDEFENIHVYPFICNLLAIEIPEEVDGDPSVLSAYLSK